MNKKALLKYGTNKKELTMINSSLERLYERLQEVPTVQGKVTKSSDDFPYIEEHITVHMAEPEIADRIKRKISEKELRKKELLYEQRIVEDYITAIPDGTVRGIFEMVYQNDMSLQSVGDLLGYTKGRISQIISNYLKD